MPKKYRKLWVFGDSYTTPGYCVDPQHSFWGLTASTQGIDTICNCSRPSNSWTTIQQLLVGMHADIEWSQDLVFVGVPPLERITVFDDYRDTAYSAHMIDTGTWHSHTIDVPCHRGLITLQNFGEDRQLVLHSDRSWLETDTLRQIFLLTQWLDSVGAHYLIINLSKDFDSNNHWGPSTFVLDHCLHHPNTILFQDTYHGINIGVNRPVDSDRPEGHHGSAGNRYFFEKSLLPKLKESGLC